jgi:hypothetical protein
MPLGQKGWIALALGVAPTVSLLAGRQGKAGMFSAGRLATRRFDREYRRFVIAFHFDSA